MRSFKTYRVLGFLMAPEQLQKMPASVINATIMMYLVVALGFVRTSMTVIRHLEVRTPYFYISGKLLIYAVSIFLIFQVGNGGNWARWSLTVILLIAIPLGVLPTFDAIGHSPFHSLLGLAQLGLYIAAVIFLFHRDSSAWFQSPKKSDSQS